jgi:hypothetical protein
MRLAVVPGAVLLLGALSACSLGSTQHTAAATTSKAAPSPSAVTTYNPLAGPVEAAAQLPKSCSTILSDTDLTAAFGSPQVGSTSYGDYAPLPTIGRTGRVTCGFAIGIDQSGNAGPAAATVSVITYNTANNAVTRVAADVASNVAKGLTAQPVLVDGHPATVIIQQAASASASAQPTASTSGGASPAAPASPAPSASATSAAVTSTELLMADGNRTFVVEIPLSKLSGTGAVNVLINLATLVYRHTLPAGSSPSASAPTTAKASASPSASHS